MDYCSMNSSMVSSMDSSTGEPTVVEPSVRSGVCGNMNFPHLILLQ